MSLTKNREQLAGHLAVAGAYVIFGLNLVCCNNLSYIIDTAEIRYILFHLVAVLLIDIDKTYEI